MNELKIFTSMDGGTLVMQLVGRVTATNAEQIMVEAKKEYNLFSNVRLDAKDLEYISSAGLRQFMLLMTLTKTKGGQVSIANMNEDVQEILEDTGFIDQLVVE